jgi:hypothetical protein
VELIIMGIITTPTSCAGNDDDEDDGEVVTGALVADGEMGRVAKIVSIGSRVICGVERDKKDDEEEAGDEAVRIAAATVVACAAFEVCVCWSLVAPVAVPLSAKGALNRELGALRVSL